MRSLSVLAEAEPRTRAEALANLPSPPRSAGSPPLPPDIVPPADGRLWIALFFRLRRRPAHTPARLSPPRRLRFSRSPVPFPTTSRSLMLAHPAARTARIHLLSPHRRTIYRKAMPAASSSRPPKKGPSLSARWVPELQAVVSAANPLMVPYLQLGTTRTAANTRTRRTRLPRPPAQAARPKSHL